jgi:hypothetical protein
MMDQRFGTPQGVEPGHTFVLVDEDGRVAWIGDYGARETRTFGVHNRPNLSVAKVLFRSPIAGPTGVQPAAVRPTRSALTCQSRDATASS